MYTFVNDGKTVKIITIHKTNVCHHDLWTAHFELCDMVNEPAGSRHKGMNIVRNNIQVGRGF